MLELVGMVVRAGSVRLNGAGFAAARGAITTLLAAGGEDEQIAQLLTGRQTPESGRIALDGDALTAKDLKRRARIVDADTTARDRTSVRGFIEKAYDSRNRAKAAREATSETLGRHGLEAMAARTMLSLTAAERLMVQAVAARAAETDIVIVRIPADAAAGSLDGFLSGALASVFEGARAVVLLLTRTAGDTLAANALTHVMHDGVVLQSGPAADIWRRPLDLATARLMAHPALNELPVHIEKGVKRLPDGCTLAVPPGLGALADGDFTLAFRPQHAAMARASDAGLRFVATRAAGQNAGFAELSFCTRSWLATPAADPAADVAPGVTLNIFVEPADMLVYDAAGGLVEGRREFASA